MERKQIIQNLHTNDKYTSASAAAAQLTDLLDGEIAVQNNSEEAALYIKKGNTVGRFVEETVVDSKITSAKNEVLAHTVNEKALSGNPILNGADIKLDGYKKAGLVRSIAATDTVNSAIGILEKKIDDAATGGLTAVTGGNGIEVSEKVSGIQTISAKIDANTEESTSGSAFLTVGTDGLKVDGIKDEIDDKINQLNATKSGSSTGNYVKVSVAEASGKVSTVAVTATTQAVSASSSSAKGLAEASDVKSYVDGKIDALDYTDTAATNQYVSKVDEADGVISVTRTALPVTGVKSGDSVLSMTGTQVQSTISLDYVKNDKKIYLKGIGGAVISNIDATDFVKDGMLDSVSLKVEGGKTYIHFVWNTDAGKTEFDLDVSSLIDTYTAGDGLALSDHTFSVKKDTSSESFLSVSTGGVKVSGVQDAINAGIASAETYTDQKISGLDVTAITVGASKTLSSISETDGKISATPVDIQIAESQVTNLTGDLKTIREYTVNGHQISGNPVLNGADIKLTGYASGGTGDVAATDTTNQAVSKVETKANQGVSAITVNGINATVSNRKATVTIEGKDIQVGSAVTMSGVSITETTDTIPAAMNKMAEIMVENEETTAAALTDLDARINDLTGSSHSHANKEVLDEITDAKVESWDSIAEDGLTSVAVTGINGVTTSEANHVSTIDFSNAVIDGGTW